MEMIMMRSLGTAVCTMLVLAQIEPAAAQTSPVTKFTGFLCEINIGENGLNTSQFVSPLIKDGIVYTFASTKLCTGSAPGQNIKIDCTARIPGWRGGASRDRTSLALSVLLPAARRASDRRQQQAHRRRGRQRDLDLSGKVSGRRKCEVQ
jgi:hypothetical protein